MFLQDRSSSVNSKLTVKFQSTVHAQTSVQALAYGVLFIYSFIVCQKSSM